MFSDICRFYQEIVILSEAKDLLLACVGTKQVLRFAQHDKP
jgi:hypothetical protein